MTKSKAEIEKDEKKAEFVKYFEDVPVQKYASMYVGITEQTAINWMKDDEAFFNAVNLARAKWVKKKNLKVKAEFALERLEHDVFKQRSETELNGNVGVALSAEQAEQLIRARAKRSNT